MALDDNGGNDQETDERRERISAQILAGWGDSTFRLTDAGRDRVAKEAVALADALLKALREG